MMEFETEETKRGKGTIRTKGRPAGPYTSI